MPIANLAGMLGIEPRTVRLTAGCSTAELHAKTGAGLPPACSLCCCQGRLFGVVPAAPAASARSDDSRERVSPCGVWCRQQESNPRPAAYKAAALPAELYRLKLCQVLPSAWRPQFMLASQPRLGDVSGCVGQFGALMLVAGADLRLVGAYTLTHGTACAALKPCASACAFTCIGRGIRRTERNGQRTRNLLECLSDTDCLRQSIDMLWMREACARAVNHHPAWGDI